MSVNDDDTWLLALALILLLVTKPFSGASKKSAWLRVILALAVIAGLIALLVLFVF